jgi:hypothetical protein
MKKIIFLLFIVFSESCHAPIIKRPSSLDIRLKLTSKQQSEYDAFFFKTVTNFKKLIREQEMFAQKSVAENLKACSKKGLTLSAYLKQCRNLQPKRQCTPLPQRILYTIPE